LLSSSSLFWMLEDRLDQAAIDLPTIMHQRDRRVRDPPNHRLNTAEDLAEVISLNEFRHCSVWLYAADDPLVQPFHATMMAGYQAGNPLQRTLEIAHGNHAYFYDRWWQQRAILLYFKTVLPGASGDPRIGTMPTVNRTSGGAPARSQLIDLGAPTPAYADAQAAPFACDTAEPPPAFAAP